MKNYTTHLLKFLCACFLIAFSSCQKEEANTTFTPPQKDEKKAHPNDVYLKQNMFSKYGTAVRWRWDDRFIRSTQNATPIRAEHVVPVTKIVEYLWIGAYESVGPAGEKFIKTLFPPELQYIGSYIFREDGTRLLGYAEGGARISLLNLNSYDLTDRDWMTNPGGGVLATVHHEFSHIVHQNHNLPPGFNTISDQYLGAGWSNGVSLKDAIKMGMVRNYGTMNEFEDFCEIISHFLTLPKKDFEAAFINQADCSKLTKIDQIRDCQELNEGRLLIKKKLDLVVKFYKDKFDIDLAKVRDNLEERIDFVVKNNRIPN